MILLLASLAQAAPAVDTIDVTGTDTAIGSACSSHFDTLAASAIHEFTLPDDEIASLEGIALTIEYQRKDCLVEIDDVEILLDGVPVFTETIALSSSGSGETVAGWFTVADPGAPDVHDLLLDGGFHELQAIIHGGGTTADNAIRVTLDATLTHGRDWDSDGHDDPRLAGGDDCDDDDPTAYPGATGWTEDCDPVEDDSSGDDGGCNCSTASGPGSLAWFGLVGALLALRRRTSGRK